MAAEKDLNRLILHMAELIPRQVMTLAIIEGVARAATDIAEAVKSIPAYKLPRIAIAARHRKAAAFTLIGIAGMVAAARIMRITTQPIPKYAEGMKK